MKSLKLIWQKQAPLFIQNSINMLTDAEVNKSRRKSVLKQYKNSAKENQPLEIQEAIKFLKSHRFTNFPYNWSLKYLNYIPEIYKDPTNLFYYTIFEGKKLFFPKSYSENQVLWTVRSILKEQDINSPHLYLTHEFQIEDNSVLIDAGVAEGSFSLSAIDKVKKLYLIECEPAWVEALKMTFAPWKDKVVFIGKYLSDKESENTISIDAIKDLNLNDKYFLKFDVEGYEKPSLEGMKDFFTQVKNIKMTVATYHFKNDAEDINKILTSKGLTCHSSESYLLFNNGDEVPNFRKAIIRAEKKSI
jgi:hypothetical protein